jgi:hypothetical protein
LEVLNDTSTISRQVTPMSDVAKIILQNGDKVRIELI